MILTSKKELGELIYIHRKKAKLSRIELATISGLGKTVIYDIEKGVKNVRIETLYQILKSLNIRIEFNSPVLDEINSDIDSKTNK